VRRVRDKHNAQDFYTSSLKPEIHLVSQGNPRLPLHYLRFTKFTTLHFQNMQKHHTMTLELYKNHTKTTREPLQT